MTQGEEELGPVQLAAGTPGVLPASPGVGDREGRLLGGSPLTASPV